MSNDPTIPIEPDTITRPEAPKVAPALGQRVASGFAWVGINTLANKFILLLVQLVLGWLLVPEDFGLVASVTAITTLANPARLLNVNTFLSRRPKETSVWANASIWLTSCAVVVGAVLLACLAPLLAMRDAHPQRYLLCMAFAIAANSIETLVTPFTGVLNGRMAFGFQTRVAISLVAGQSLLSLLLAKFHFGPYSILVPAFLVSFFRLALHARASKVSFHRSPQTHLWRTIAVEGIWNSIAQFALLVMVQASYVGLGWFHGTYDTGQYFVAFTAAVQALFLVSSGLSAVLLPAMSQASSTEHRRSMYVTCCRLLVLVTAPLCMMQTLAIGPAFELVYHDKWADAITMAQFLSLGTLLRIVSFPSQSLFIAEGRLTLYAAWTLAWALAFCAVVVLASWLGSPMTLTIAVVAFYCLFDPLTGALAFRVCGLSIPNAIGTVTAMHIVPLLGSLIGGAAVWYLQSFLTTLHAGPRLTLVFQLAVTILVPVLYLPVSMLLAREDSRRLQDIFARLFLSRIPGRSRLTRAFGTKTA